MKIRPMNLKHLKTAYEREQTAIKKLKSCFPHLADMSKEALLAYFNCTASSELVDIGQILSNSLTTSHDVTKKDYCRCIDSNGIPKLLYPTHDEAERIELYAKIKKRTILKIYPCPHAKGWHLSKSKG